MGSHLFIKLYRLFAIQFLKLLVSIVVVVLPLVNLMKDQVDKLANLGILAASLSEITEKNAKGVFFQSYIEVRKCGSEPTQLLQFANKFVIKPSYLSSAK